jgi:hypothetical protein
VNQPEAFTNKHHFIVKSADALKVALMIATPPFKVIILSLGKRKILFNVAEPHLGNFQRFEKQGFRCL